MKSVFQFLKFEVSWAMGDSILRSVPSSFLIGSYSVPSPHGSLPHAMSTADSPQRTSDNFGNYLQRPAFA